MGDLEDLLNVEDVSKKLRIAKSTVYTYVHQGILPSIKIGKSVRFSPTDVYRAVEKMKLKSMGEANVAA